MLVKLLQTWPAASVIKADGTYIPVDLSVNNPDLPVGATADAFEDFLDDFLKNNTASVAYGGYLEHRNLYRRSGIFNGDESAPRDIHIGLDLWAKAGTEIHAPLDGKVHSFAYNVGLGNYGPTIILEHDINGIRFYTLYGHLSVESIEELEIGDTYKAGQVLATLGDASVNGDYAPHLHFQIIKDIEGNFGDYPGVCSATDLDFYQSNCPDPNLLLKLN